MIESTFIETMSRAISDYRQILKKYLTPQQRNAKIAQLRLKDPSIFFSESVLFRVAKEILADIEKNIRIPNEGYYSYYGIVRFAKYLGEYLNNFIVEDDQVIHKAQKASGLLVKTIQLLSVPGEQLTEQVVQQVVAYHPLILELASQDQISLYTSTLERLYEKNKTFFRKVMHDFETRLGETLAQAA